MSSESERYQVGQQGPTYYVVDCFMRCGVGEERNAHLVGAYESHDRASVRAHEMNQGARLLTRYYLLPFSDSQAKTLVREVHPGFRRQYFDEAKIEWRDDPRIGMGLGWNDLELQPGPPRPIAWEAAMRRLEESGGRPDEVDLSA